MDSRKTVLFAILAATLMVAVSVGCAMAVNNTTSNDTSDTAFSADVWKKNSDDDEKNADALGIWIRPPKFDSVDAIAYNAIRPIIHFDDYSAADSNEKVTPEWFVDKVFEKKTRSTDAVFSIEFVVELCDGVIMYGGPMYYPGLTNVHHGSSCFGGTLEEFKEYVLANECEWELPNKEYTFP